MKNKFISIGFDKDSEIDVYSEGCIPNSGSSFYDSTTIIKGESVEQVVEKIKDLLGVDDNNCFEFNACDEDGRIDVQVLENVEGLAASDYEIKLWKENKLTLWAATYTFRVYQLAELKINEEALK